MKRKSVQGCTVAAVVVASLGCSVNTVKATSWGKEGVSLLDYQTDTILCGTLADQEAADNAANSAGGVNGKNGSGRIAGGPETGAGSASSGTNAPSISGGNYEDTVSPDYVSRAANQQRAQEMLLKQVRMESLRSCLVKRGYSEFELSPEQRSELAQLPQGSTERRDYLYKLGTNPDFLKRKPTLAK